MFQHEKSWSWLRLGSFLIGVSITLFLFSIRQNLWGLISLVIFLSCFVFCVSRHLRYQTQRKQLEKLLLIIDESLADIFATQKPIRSWQRTNDSANLTGPLCPIIKDSDPWFLSDQEKEDISLFAPPIGIFGLLNRTSTALGARRLRDHIEQSCITKEHILTRQAAVCWLDQHPEHRLRLMAVTAWLRNHDQTLEKSLQAISTAQPLPHPKRISVVRAWSCLSGLAMAVIIAQGFSGQLQFAIALFPLLIINTVMFSFIRKKLAAALEPWQNLSQTMNNFYATARQAATDLPDQTDLHRLKHCFTSIAAPDILGALCRRLDWVDIGGMLQGILNALILYDLHVADSILQRAVPHRDALCDSFSALADLEALYSLACFAAEQPVACYPEITDQPEITIQKGRHPLIPPTEVVSNDVHIKTDSKLWIITGPNAAGKSTLLRMVGVNVLLAQMGCAVAAEKMSFSPVRLVTDLTIRDNLSKKESYFVTEVRHLYRMVQPQSHEIPALGLIDEPFRGTNSQEKLAASLSLIEHLASLSDFFLVATHDEALTQLAATNHTVKNYHFHEELGAQGIVFDYLLRPGPAQSRTALKILEQENYPPKMIENAYRWLADNDKK
ncbi:MAG: MutS family DNA mismatch repair protein [Planctomycetes bacterium]|nr:MutS family DNA mismatch repair protein [Planctomycetota bacterium]